MVYLWIFGGLAIGIFFSGIRIVRPIEEGLIETFGKFTKKAEQGFHWIVPFVQTMTKVDITENMVDVPPQKVITKDDLNADVDAVVYFRVKDSFKAIYKAENYYAQITSLARTTLRDIIGKMTLSEANNKRGQLNAVLEKDLDKHTAAWGIDIVRVELQRIEPPQDVQEAMNNVVKAERDKNAAIDFATAVETKADGARRAVIKEADGEKQGKILRAEGEAAAIKLVNESLRAHFKDEAQTYKALETAERSMKKGTKYVIDSKSNLVNVMSDMAGTNIVPVGKQPNKQS